MATYPAPPLDVLPADPAQGAPLDTPMIAQDEIPATEMQQAPAPTSPLNMDFSVAPATKEEFDALPRWKQKAFEAAWNGAQFTQDSLQQFVLGEMAKENDELRKKADPKYQAEISKANSEVKAKETEIAEKISTAERSHKYITSLLDNLENHPGRAYSTGKSGVLPALPGTEAKDYSVMLDQLKGKAFMQAYGGLKGGGQITEIEGKKATEAIARLNPLQTEEGFLKSLKEFRAQIDDEYQNTMKLLKPSASPASPKVLDHTMALQFLKQAGGDKAKARELAKQAGY